VYQELKSDIVSGQLPVQNMAEKLASYSLQGVCLCSTYAIDHYMCECRCIYKIGACVFYV
jgi:hypothetical protein